MSEASEIIDAVIKTITKIDESITDPPNAFQRGQLDGCSRIMEVVMAAVEKQRANIALQLEDLKNDHET